jgi:uncharacterized Zn finger protein
MTKMVYCLCPKCGKRTHNYVRDGAKEWLMVRCLNGCNIKFKVEIKDFAK